MQHTYLHYLKVRKKYLKFLKSQEVLSEPFRDKLGQLNNFYLPLSEFIFKNYSKNKKTTMGDLTQKQADEIFRDINIIVNGFYVMNYLSYYSLRLGGFLAWNGHRKRNAKIQ